MRGSSPYFPVKSAEDFVSLSKVALWVAAFVRENYYVLDIRELLTSYYSGAVIRVVDQSEGFKVQTLKIWYVYGKLLKKKLIIYFYWRNNHGKFDKMFVDFYIYFFSKYLGK